MKNGPAISACRLSRGVRLLLVIIAAFSPLRAASAQSDALNAVPVSSDSPRVCEFDICSES
jgi:hypothetical protein